ncbi:MULTISPECIES: hypothetical protein [unclassified Ruegeria]|nr:MULTISPECIES: hypothetical protein [unclassified Ruegeria]
MALPTQFHGAAVRLPEPRATTKTALPKMRLSAGVSETKITLLQARR